VKATDAGDSIAAIAVSIGLPESPCLAMPDKNQAVRLILIAHLLFSKSEQVSATRA